jgi:hypothetical protein
MAPVEKYIVGIMQSMARLRQPLNVSQGLSLANSSIEGTHWEDAVIEFKGKWKRNQHGTNGEKKPVLGKGWYRGFWKRNKHLLEKKKGQKFAKEHSEWSIHRNFVQMYDEVYQGMENAGVATRFDDPICVNEEQEETNKENAFAHLLTRPDYVVFVDECGCNTSQEGDGAVGGERKIVV